MDQLINEPFHPEGIHIWNTPIQDLYTDLAYNIGNASNISSPDKSEYLRPFERYEGQYGYYGLTWKMATILNPSQLNRFFSLLLME